MIAKEGGMEDVLDGRKVAVCLAGTWSTVHPPIKDCGVAVLCSKMEGILMLFVDGGELLWWTPAPSTSSPAVIIADVAVTVEAAFDTRVRTSLLAKLAAVAQASSRQALLLYDAPATRLYKSVAVLSVVLTFAMVLQLILYPNLARQNLRAAVSRSLRRLSQYSTLILDLPFPARRRARTCRLPTWHSCGAAAAPAALVAGAAAVAAAAAGFFVGGDPTGGQDPKGGLHRVGGADGADLGLSGVGGDGLEGQRVWQGVWVVCNRVGGAGCGEEAAVSAAR
ncbi:hypothetical protein DFJ73DRAFT_765226 [Zopfochytrium polystomum]|nr:hypothetical protein DFJ73DRAFT_765226 [Zopfochytrium polystomum]